ncbi:hypothetical protein OB920_13135 [Halobacteria archaeon HArc-gm2]|nr:hypothetical protein [Halobacteria archaeon HArc-gm2]
MQDEGSTSGPVPSSLRAVDSHPYDKLPFYNLRITYTTDSVSDWVGIHRDGRQVALELADPLVGVVRRIGQINNLKEELEEAAATIGMTGLLTEFKSAIAEFANQFLPVEAIAASISLRGAVYLLKKLYEKGLLMIGYIHHAPIEEFDRWNGLVEQGKWMSNIAAQ